MYHLSLGWRPLAVGFGLCALMCAIMSPQAKAETMASLSGYVYLDYNGSGQRDTGDYGIRNAMVTVTRSDDATYHVTKATDKDGFYSFENLPPLSGAVYALTLPHYTCVEGSDNLGVLLDASSKPVADTSLYGEAADLSGHRSFTNITLQPGFQGVNYNFGEKDFPLELMSKRYLMDWGLPQKVIVVPEPASLCLLAMGVLVLGMIRLRCR